MSAILHQCSCPHCSQNLEYDQNYSGQEIDCPSCHGKLLLPSVPFVTPRTGLIEGWIDKLRAAKAKAEDKSILQRMLMDAVSDGVLTEDEIQNVRNFLSETGFDQSIIQDWSVALFRRAFESLGNHNLSRQRIAALEKIRAFLNVPNNQITTEVAQIIRFSLLLDIREGRLPKQAAQNVILKPGEIVHWIQPARLWESRVVGRRYEGGSSGVSFRIAKGVTIRTGATRGRSVSESEDQIVSEGNFLITNQRFIFQGDRKSFESKFEKIIDIHNHVDGIRYSESNRQKQRQVEYLAANGDIIVEILSYVFSARAGRASI